jgi:hypothetical protein
LLGGAAAITNAQLSLSGGSDRLNYLLSGTYHRETSVMPARGADRSYALYFNASHNSRKQKLQTTLSVGFLSKNDNLPPVDFTGSLSHYIPNQPASFLPDGSLNFEPGMTNPYKQLKELYRMNAVNLVSSVKISYRPIRNLELSVLLGFNRQYQHDFLGVPRSAQPPVVNPMPVIAAID